jgi:SSS family solute:Na+ symporter
MFRYLPLMQVDTWIPKLHWLDYVVVFGYLAFIAILGSSFARRQKSTDRYYTGGRNIPTWAIGLSILATLISSVTFLAYPGAGYKESSWILLVQGLMVPVVLICIIWFVVPMFRKVIGISTYEYFEKRFGLIPRLYTSFSFSLMHFAKMGTVFYLMALAVGTMMGITSNEGLIYLIVILGVAVVVYTLLGGIEAVIWCDVIQGLLLMGVGVMVILTLFYKGGGPVEMVSTAWNEGKIDLSPLEPSYKWDMVHLGFWVMAINGIFYGIQKYGTDQTIIQRYLTAGSDKKAIKAALMGVLLCIPVWTLFIFIGSMLWVYYQPGVNPLKPEVVNFIGDKPERVFMYYVNSEFPVVIVGLVLAGLVAAALSSLDSDLNCLSAVVVEDYYRRIRKNSTDKQRLRFGRIVVAACGLYAIGVAILYVFFQGKMPVLKIIFELYAIFSGGIAGLFILAFFTRRANLKGVYVGLIACILFTAWGFLTGPPLDPGEQMWLNLNNLSNSLLGTSTFGIAEGQISLNFPHHRYMLGVYSHIVLFIAGYIASLFFRHDRDISGLTFYDWRKTHKTVAEAIKEQ